MVRRAFLRRAYYNSQKSTSHQGIFRFKYCADQYAIFATRHSSKNIDSFLFLRKIRLIFLLIAVPKMQDGYGKTIGGRTYVTAERWRTEKMELGWIGRSPGVK